MSKPIRTVVALVVVAASLAFSAIGVVRAASGVVLGAFPHLSSSFVSLADASQTPEPTQTAESTQTVVANVSPEPTHVGEADDMEKDSDADEVHATGTPQAGHTEMDDGNSQGNSNSQGDDSQGGFGTPQPGSSEDHHSGWGGSGSGGSGSGSGGGDDGGGD